MHVIPLSIYCYSSLSSTPAGQQYAAKEEMIRSQSDLREPSLQPKLNALRNTSHQFDIYERKAVEFEQKFKVLKILITKQVKFSVIEKAELLSKMGSGIIGKFKQNKEGQQIIQESLEEIVSLARDLVKFLPYFREVSRSLIRPAFEDANLSTRELNKKHTSGASIRSESYPETLPNQQKSLPKAPIADDEYHQLLRDAEDHLNASETRCDELTAAVQQQNLHLTHQTQEMNAQKCHIYTQRTDSNFNVNFVDMELLALKGLHETYSLLSRDLEAKDLQIVSLESELKQLKPLPLLEDQYRNLLHEDSETSVVLDSPPTLLSSSDAQLRLKKDNERIQELLNHIQKLEYDLDMMKKSMEERESGQDVIHQEYTRDLVQSQLQITALKSERDEFQRQISDLRSDNDAYQKKNLSHLLNVEKERDEALARCDILLNEIQQLSTNLEESRSTVKGLENDHAEEAIKLAMNAVSIKKLIEKDFQIKSQSTELKELNAIYSALLNDTKTLQDCQIAALQALEDEKSKHYHTQTALQSTAVELTAIDAINLSLRDELQEIIKSADKEKDSLESKISTHLFDATELRRAIDDKELVCESLNSDIVNHVQKIDDLNEELEIARAAYLDKSVQMENSRLECHELADNCSAQNTLISDLRVQLESDANAVAVTAHKRSSSDESQKLNDLIAANMDLTLALAKTQQQLQASKPTKNPKGWW